MGTLWTTEVVILTGRSIVPAGASNEDTPEVMAMKSELVALRAFKATTHLQVLPALANGLPRNKTDCLNYALQGSCTILPLLPIQGGRGAGAGIVSINKRRL